MPQNSGIYWFLDSNERVLYIGKARNIKHRLLSYTHTASLQPKTIMMLAKAQTVGFHSTFSEIAALLLEAEAVHEFNPPYNILLKDDKSPLYVVITKEIYPRVLMVRKTSLADLEPLRIFGPFLSSRDIRFVLKKVRAIFPFCNQNPQDIARQKPCFYSHLGLCAGVCTGVVTPKRYAKNILGLTKFLAGDITQIKQNLTRSLNLEVNQQNFETAGTIKNQLQKIDQLEASFNYQSDETNLFALNGLAKLLSQAGLTCDVRQLSRIEAFDVAHLGGQAATAAMVVALDGHLAVAAYRHFKIKSSETCHDPAMLGEIITRRLNHPDWPLPGLIVLDGGRTQLASVKPLLPASVLLIGLAKHPDHLVISLGLSYTRIVLDVGTPATNLLQQLRDEAHRFARRLHHQLIDWEYH